MPLTPWRSMWDKRFPSLQEEMDRIFEDFFSDAGLVSLSETSWLPPVDIIEGEKNIIVVMDLPAIKPEDISVTVMEDMLTIEGERKREEAFKDREYYRSERVHGSFLRTVSLPGSVIGDRAAASYKDGVLTIELPKSRKERAKEIKIDIESATPTKIATQTAKQRRKK